MTSNSGQNWFAPSVEAGPAVLQDLPEDASTSLLEAVSTATLSALDAHAVLREALLDCEGARRSRRVHVSLRLLARNHYVMADANRLRLVLTQMLRGAIESAPTGSQMTIRSSRPADCALRIEVEERSSYLKNQHPADPGPAKGRTAVPRRRQ